MNLNNQSTFRQSSDAIGTKNIVPILIAVVIVLIFLYGVYSVFIQKDNFLINKLGTPSSTNDAQQIHFPTQQTVVTGSQVDILEKSILANEQLQGLQVYGSRDFNLQTEGNHNPFKPFSNAIVEKPKTPKLELEDIEKPLPRINNGQ